MRDDRSPPSPAQLQEFIREPLTGIDRLVARSYEFPHPPRNNALRECDSRVHLSRFLSDDGYIDYASLNASDIHRPGIDTQCLPDASDESSGSDTDSPGSEAPSLTTSGSSRDGSSLPTDLASVVTGFPLLDENGEPTQHAPAKPYECPFPFLRCQFSTDDEDEYKSHSLSHFFLRQRGCVIEPPCQLECPLCDWAIDESYPFKDGWEAWDARMSHVAMHHRQGHSLASSRPCFPFFFWLRQKLLIEKSTWRHLMDDHTARRLDDPAEPPKSQQPLVTVESSSRRRERDRFRGRRK